MDHDLDYFDISEGVFNNFDESDYNKLNEKAKSFIESKALESSLKTETADREAELIEMLKFICRGMGWELKISKQKPTDNLTG